MLQRIKNALNLREHLRRVCAHCFPKDQLFHELTRVLEEQRRKVINDEDALIACRFNLQKEKARLAAFERHHTQLKRDLEI